jgi:tRNA 2-thiouridine synthesizing protein A
LEPDKKIDCLGLYCPEPLFRTRMALDEMEKGEILEVKADDPAAEEDLKRLAQRLGYEIMSVTHDDDEVTILIRK